MNLKKLIELDYKIKKENEIIDDITLTLSENVLTKKDILNTYLAVSFLTFIAFFILSKSAFYFFSVVDTGGSGVDIRVLIGLFCSMFSLIFVVIPFNFYRKDDIYRFKDAFNSAQIRDLLFSRTMFFMSLCLVPIFFTFLFSANDYYSSGSDVAASESFKSFKLVIEFLYYYGAYVTIGGLTITNLYHYNTVSEHFKNGETLEDLNKRFKTSNKNIEEYIEESKKHIKKHFVNYNDLEYLRVKVEDFNLNHISPFLSSIENDIAKTKGFTDFSEMKKVSIQNNFKQNKIINE